MLLKNVLDLHEMVSLTWLLMSKYSLPILLPHEPISFPFSTSPFVLDHAEYHVTLPQIMLDDHKSSEGTVYPSSENDSLSTVLELNRLRYDFSRCVRLSKRLAHAHKTIHSHFRKENMDVHVVSTNKALSFDSAHACMESDYIRQLEFGCFGR